MVSQATMAKTHPLVCHVYFLPIQEEFWVTDSFIHSIRLKNSNATCYAKSHV